MRVSPTPYLFQICKGWMTLTLSLHGECKTSKKRTISNILFVFKVLVNYCFPCLIPLLKLLFFEFEWKLKAMITMLIFVIFLTFCNFVMNKVFEGKNGSHSRLIYIIRKVRMLRLWIKYFI